MNSLNQVNIVEVSTRYDVKLPYHSELMAQNYDGKIRVIEESDNRISLYPDSGHERWMERGFVFEHSDPDRVIAVAQMMMAAAQMVKNHNQKPIDIDEEA